MDNNRRRLDFPGMISSRRRTANRQCETECEETNSSHEREYETEEADLLSPGPLLLGSSDAKNPEERGRNTTCDGEAVKEPAVLWTRAKGI